jgi:hypothetical protein
MKKNYQILHNSIHLASEWLSSSILLLCNNCPQHYSVREILMPEKNYKWNKVIYHFKLFPHIFLHSHMFSTHKIAARENESIILCESVYNKDFYGLICHDLSRKMQFINTFIFHLCLDNFLLAEFLFLSSIFIFRLTFICFFIRHT